ncbi:lipopolysaccharide core biosynthesis protein [compost metagenome]|jgi:KDO transferase-3|uniref:Lipopolysaccharide core biosynthesis protein RfaZ n=1 Tax=Pseudomonas wadenswilerensis TaxID=1785161 RepID=A0A380SV77_9PSED|nr:lipopolysaccharide biosynthesis protein [Pseudomonas]MCE5984366.1 lipopolysaccharide biosynthesis protein [Pseudomonas sp. LF19]UVM21513.1 lipopolysaccharide biosynthesis protein [Pseudomonas wadenswilerensis]SPO64671.1 conserved protein of unknown function [Pseudomonas sp. JV241A]SUQ61181.1 Lipopolysaccharide core biosynthesis protein RfaZ [Pseudomonas wadenswilerensis]
MGASAARSLLGERCNIHDFADCQNIQSGSVFIIASGGSAKDFPFQTFHDIPMITMNGAISMFLDTPVRPFFYACTDRDFSNQQPQLFAEALHRSDRVALWEEHVRSLSIRTDGELYLLHKAPKPSFIDILRRKDQELVRNHTFPGWGQKLLGFSKNLQRGFFDARTVAYLALQIAYHVGFTKVFLVGVDLNQDLGRFYERNDMAVSPCGLDQHYESRILPSFQLVANSVVDDTFAVYNLSEFSRLPHSVIPYKTLEEVTAMVREG